MDGRTSRREGEEDRDQAMPVLQQAMTSLLSPRELLAVAVAPRTRTVTMDSEEAEEVLAEEDLVYEDDDLSAHTLTRLNTMRKADRFCDVTLKVGSGSIPAHRAVLASASTYLFELFTAEDSTCTERNYYQLDELEYDCVSCLVDFAYTARLEVPRERVKAVYKTATLLKMQQAADACSTFLAKHLSPDNCLGTRSFANSHCDGDLTCKTDDYIQLNIGNVVKSAEMQKLPTIQIEVMGVTSSELKEQGERQLSQMVVDWLEQALAERSFTALCEDRQVLYLTTDNNLRDCLDLADDDRASELASNIIIQDYQKLGKRKKMAPVKGSSKDKPSQRQGQQQNGTLRRLSSSEKLALFEKEWKVIATEVIGDQTCYCLAMLDDRLTNLSLRFRPYPNTPPGSVSGGASPASGSPKGSMTMLATGKQCSLTPLAPMSLPRCAHGTAVMDGKLIVIGGYDRGECHQSVEAYDNVENSWSQLPPMAEARARFDVSLVAGRLYACGGSNGSQELKSVECFDPVLNKWSPVSNMTSRRSSAGVSVLNDMLYIIGGWSGQAGVRNCERYDQHSGAWTRIAKLNTGRSQAGVCAYAGQIVAVGGCDAWQPMNTVEIYSPDENKWTFLPPMTTSRRGAGTAVVKDQLYVVGGSDGQASLASIEIYSPGTQSWVPGPMLSVPRANVSLSVLSRRLYAVGGFSGKAFLDTIEYLAEDGREWCGFVPALNGHLEDGDDEEVFNGDVVAPSGKVNGQIGAEGFNGGVVGEGGKENGDVVGEHGEGDAAPKEKRVNGDVVNLSNGDVVPVGGNS